MKTILFVCLLCVSLCYGQWAGKEYKLIPFREGSSVLRENIAFRFGSLESCRKFYSRIKSERSTDCETDDACAASFLILTTPSFGTTGLFKNCTLYAPSTSKEDSPTGVALYGGYGQPKFGNVGEHGSVYLSGSTYNKASAYPIGKISLVYSSMDKCTEDYIGFKTSCKVVAACENNDPRIRMNLLYPPPGRLKLLKWCYTTNATRFDSVQGLAAF